MSNKKHTAIDWLKEQLETYGNQSYCVVEWSMLDKLTVQAKEMHEQEIETAHTLGYIIGGGNGDLYDCKQYYKETYETSH